MTGRESGSDHWFTAEADRYATVIKNETLSKLLKRYAKYGWWLIASESTAHFYDKTASEFNELCFRDYFLAEKIAETYFAGGGAKALDLACGTGLSAFPLRDRFKEVIGVDISRGMLEEGKKMAERHPEEFAGEKNLAFVQGSFARLPFADGVFDGVTCVDAIDVLPVAQKERFAHEVCRVLQPGGRLIVTVQAFEINGRYKRLLSKIWNRSPLRNVYQWGVYTAEYLSELVKDQGFRTEIEGVVFYDGESYDFRQVVVADKPV